MRDVVKAASKEVRAVFTDAVNAAVAEAISKVRAKSELRRRRNVREAARVAENEDCRRRDQEEEETSFSVQSSMSNELLAAAAEKSEGGRLRAVKETIASVTADKDRDMEEAVERAIAECGRGLYRAVSEERVKFDTEAVEDRKQVVEEAVNSLRERHDLELCKAVDRSIAEKEEAAAACPERGAAYSGSGGGENWCWGKI